jgi:16S rRNA (cytidine1402-2'-O)-methyltransferase
METAPPPTGPVQANPPASAPLVPGTLYLVATPIGNLEDITFRALRVLRECSVVAAEDTRHTGQLLTHFGLRKQMVSYFRFNEARRGAEILDRLRCGETVALVTDAGSPGISDPGERIVAEVLAAGLRVESIPGACALVTGLTASGLPTESFHFAGFLPHKSGQRARRLTELGAIPGTLVLYESPFRVERLLGELQRILPGRRVVLARELTKKFEEWLRGTPEELLAEWSRRPRKGEFVVMIGPGNGPVGEVAGPDMAAPQPGGHDSDETERGTDPETDSAVD